MKDPVRRIVRRSVTAARWLRPRLPAPVLAGLMIAANPGYGAPTGGVIVAGQGAIARPDAATTVITQGSQSMIAEWQTFDVDAGERVRFDQPNASAAALNRIFDEDPSRIFGSLSANGRVFLANPNGLVFGPTARVDVGALVATTLSIDNESFMSGRYAFDSPGGGAILNQGVIRAADGGSVTLLAERVRNEGLIVANFGQVHLASGGSAVIDFDGDGLIGFEVDGDAVRRGSVRRVDNAGRIEAAGGRVVMTARTADALISSVVNNEGVVRASSVVERGGVIELTGDDRVEAGGVLDVSGVDGARGGRVDVLGDEVVVTRGARLDASGHAGGGKIHIGGNYQGRGPLPNARTATVESGARISADAVARGDGGRVIIWSDDTTRVDGRISARGGPLGGDGGFVETSGKRRLDFSLPVDVSAPAGAAGTWLIDPEDIVIDNSKAASIETALNDGSSVSIVTSAEGEGEGNITVAASITKSEGGDAALTLDAHNKIDVNAPIKSTSGKLDVNLRAGKAVNINSEIDGNAGRVSATITGPRVVDTVETTDPGADMSGNASSGSASGSVADSGSANPGEDAPATGGNSSVAGNDTPTDAGAQQVASGGDSGGPLAGTGPLVTGEPELDSGSLSHDTGAEPVPDLAAASDRDGIAVDGAIVSRGAEVALDSGDLGTRVSGVIDVSDDAGQGGAVSIHGRDIVLDGATIDASGAEGGGDILIGADAEGSLSDRTGSTVTISAGTAIDAGATGNGDGGTVAVWSRDATVHRGKISTRGGAAGGDGGFVEVSSVKHVSLDGGTFDVTAPAGRHGTILIDPVTLDITTDQLSGGGALLFEADERITVASGVLISTRDIGAGTDHLNDVSVSDSGDLTFRSPLIEVGTGAELLAFADGGFTSGNILLEAVIANDSTAATADGVVSTESRIDVDGATLRGGNVELRATAETAVIYDDSTVYTGSGTQYTDVASRLGTRLGHGFGGNQVLAGVSVAGAAAIIDVNDSALIADEGVTISASALASATVRTTDEALSVAYGETNATATVGITGGSQLNAGSDVLVESKTVNTTTVATNARKNQVLRPLLGPNEKVHVTLAVADTIADSSATLDETSSIDAGGTATVKAGSDKTIASLSAANAFLDGTLGQSTSLSFADVTTEARVNGAVTAADLEVLAQTNTLASNTGALAGFKGTANTKQLRQNVSGQLNAFFVDQTLQHTLGISLATAIPDVGSLFDQAYTDLSQAFQNQFGASLPSTNTFNQQVTNPVTNAIQNRIYRALVWELPGSAAFSDQVNETNAVIGPNAVVKVDNDVDVKAGMLDDGVQNFSHSAVQLHNTTYYPTAPNQRDVTSVAILATVHDNDANAIIENGAVVDAGGALLVSATTDLPNDGILWPDTSPIDNAVDKLSAIDLSLQGIADAPSLLGGIFSDFTDELRDEGDILAGLVTTSAKARAGTKNRRFGADNLIGIAGSANLVKIENNALARIGDGAQINQDLNYRTADQDVTVEATASLSTVNLSGNIGVIPPPGGTGTADPDSDKGKFLGVDKSVRDTNGAGSSLMGLQFVNGAIAEIGNGVSLHADDLVVSSGSQISNLQAAVASGTGERYGIKGSFSGTDILSNSQAKIDDGATVNATTVGVTAANATPRNLNVAVGEINERSTGASPTSRPDDRWAAAVVDNLLTRNVDAFIGNRAGESVGAGSVDADTIQVTAANSGQIEGYSLAVDRTTGPTIFGSRPPAQQMYHQNRGLYRQGQGTHFGVRVSADVSRNRIEDDTSAYIDGGVAVTATGDVALNATSLNEISAIAGAATLMSDRNTTNAQTAIAGAYSENIIGANNAAYIAGADIAGSALLSLDATTVSTISGVAAGGSISNSSDAVMGSVAYNAIGNAPEVLGIFPAINGYGTRAYIQGTAVPNSASIDIDATETSTIDAIAGALAKSSLGGYGGAVAVNAIGNRVDAAIEDATVDTPGALTVDAASNAAIDAFAGALAKGDEDAFAGALGWNDIANVTGAGIRDGKAGGRSVAAGSIAITAADDSLIDAFAGALGNSQNRAIGAAVGVNEIANQTLAGISNAVVTAPTIDINAHAGQPGDPTLIDTWVAGLALGGGDAFSVSVAINDIANTTEAFVTGGAEIRNGATNDVLSLDLDAENYSTIDLFSVSITNSDSSSSGSNTRVNQNPTQHLTPGGSSGFGIDLSVDVALNGIHDNTRAYINGASEVEIAGPVSLTALSDSTIDVLAGAVERTTGNTGGSGDVFGLAGVFSMNTLDGETAAYVDNADVMTDAALALEAIRRGTVDAYALGWKAGSKVGLAGAATFNDVDTSTLARLRDNARISSGAETSLIATDTVDLFSLAGALSTGSTTAGIGAGIAINDISRLTQAVVDNSAVESGGLSLDAHTGGVTESWAISVEKAPAGLSGTLTFNRFNDATEAVVENGRGARSVVSGGEVEIKARNTIEAFSLSGAGAISGSGRGGGLPPTSVGVAVAWNEMGQGNRTLAAIRNASMSIDPLAGSPASIGVVAMTDGVFESFAVAGAIDGDITIAGSAVINSLAGLTEALVDNSDVFASENLWIVADNFLDVDSLAGAAAVSFGSQSQSVGVGGAATVNLLDTTTRARVIDSNGAQDGFTQVTALGNGIADPVYSGGYVDAAPLGTRLVESAAGLGVIGSSLIDVDSVNVSLSVDSLALGAAVSVSLVNDIVNASIGTGVQVNPVNASAADAQSVHVVAGNHHQLTSNDWTVAAADQDAAVGAAVDYTYFGKTTEATLDDADIEAKRRVALRARSDEYLDTAVIGGGVGNSTGAIAGSASIVEFDNQTDATVDAGDIETPGDVEVLAADTSSTDLVAGGFSAGNNTVGVGGSLAYVSTKNRTNAYIKEAASVDASGLTTVRANGVQDLDSAAVAGRAGGGQFAIAGAASVKRLNSSTIAGVTQGALVNQDPLFTGTDQDVLVAAQGDVLVNGFATGIQLGGNLGIGAGVDVNLVNDTVLASIEDDTEDTRVAGRDIGVRATSRKDVGSQAYAGSASQNVTLSGAVAVTAVGSGINQDVADAIADLDVFGVGASNPLQGPSLPSAGNVPSRVNNTMGNTTPVGAAAQVTGVLPVSGTTARIGANAETLAARDVDVESFLESDNDLVAGNIGFSQNAEIGAGVSFLTLRDTTRADITTPDQVRAGNDVQVAADERAVSNKSTLAGDNDTSTVAGFSGGAASLRLGGGVVYVDKRNSTLATIADTGDMPVEAVGGSLSILSTSSGLINSTAAGVTAGGNDLSGAVVINNLHSLTEARALRASLRADDNLLVFADAANGLELFGGKFSLPSGVEVGGTLTTVISDNETRAYLDDQTDAWAGGNGLAMMIDDGGITAPTVNLPIGEVDLDKEAGLPTFDLVKGVGVVATSVNNIDHVSISGSLGGSFGVAASLSASFIDDTVESYVGSAGLGGVSVNDPGLGLTPGEEQQVRVVAGNHTATNALAGEGSLGGSGGVGGALNLVSFAKQTRASIDNADGVYAEQHVGVDAVSSEQQSAVAVAGALAQPMSLAGAAGIVVVDNLTEAKIVASTVRTPGDLEVTARSHSELDMLTGGASLSTGTLGVGVGLDVIELTSETRAFIDDVDGTSDSVDAGGTLTVDAESVNDVFDIAMAGTAAANASIAGGISIKTAETITEAYLADGVRVNQDDSLRSASQHVDIGARDLLTIRGAAGAVALASPTSGGAIGAGIDIVVANDRVVAATGSGSDVDAGGDVTVASTAEKSISSLAIGASAGTLAASGAVSSVVLGSGQQGEAAIGIDALLDEFDDGVDTIANDYLVNPIRDQVGLTTTAQNAAARTPDLSGLSRHLKAGAPVPADALTLASVGSEAAVDAGDEVRVEATNRTDVWSTAGNGTAAGLGIGAGIAAVVAANDVEANVGAGASITSGDDMMIRARYLGMPSPLVTGRNVTAAAYGGALVAGGAQISLSHAEVNPLLDAFAGGGASLTVGNDLVIDTAYDIDQWADAVAVTVGAETGAAADARSFANPESRARLELRADVTGATDVTIANSVRGSSVATPVAASVSAAGASFVRAEAEGNALAHAFAEDGATISASGHVDIASRGSFETRAASSGGAGGAAVAVTDMTSYATGEAEFKAWVDGEDETTRVTGATVEIAAENDTGPGFSVVAENEANATIGGLLAVSPVEAVARDASRFEAYVAGNTEVSATSGGVEVGSGAPINVEATLRGGGGSVGVSYNEPRAQATADTTFAAYIDGDHDSAVTDVSGSTVTVEAGGRGDVESRASITGVAIGLLGGVNDVAATATNNAAMDAYVQGRARVEAADLVLADPAIRVLAGSDTVTDAGVTGGSGSLLISSNHMTVTATDNSQFNAYVRGNTDYQTLVRTAPALSSILSDGIEIRAEGDIDVDAHVDGGGSVGLIGADSLMAVTATSNARRESFVDGNARVDARANDPASLFKFGGVTILSGGDIEVDAKLGGGSGSLGFSGSDLNATAVDNSVFFASVTGSDSGDVTTEVFADDGVTIRTLGGSDSADDGVHVLADIVGMSFSGIAADNYPGGTATANTQMSSWIRGNADVDAGAGALEVLAGDSVDVQSNVDAGAGAIVIAVDRPTATATGNVSFTAAVDGSNPGHDTQATGNRVEVGAAGGPAGISIGAEINGGAGAGINADGLASATATDESLLQAYVRGNSDVVAVPSTGAHDLVDGHVDISSESDVEVTAEVNAGSGSLGITVDSPDATATNKTVQRAFVEGGVQQTQVSGATVAIGAGGRFKNDGGSIVETKSTIATSAEINTGAGSILATIGESTVKATDESTIDAHLVGNASVSADELLRITAISDADVSATLNTGGGSGIVNVGASDVDALGKSTRTAYVDGAGSTATVSARTLDVFASARNIARDSQGDKTDWGLSVYGLVNGGGGAGGVSVEATTLDAKDESVIEAYLTNGAVTEAGLLSARVESSGDVDVRAEQNGGSGAGLVSVATPKTTATADTDVKAWVGGAGNDATVNANDLDVIAGGRNNAVTVSAEMNGGSGAGLVGVSDTDATAKDLTRFEAFLDRGSVINLSPTLGDLNVQAFSAGSAQSVLRGGTGSGLVNVDSPTVTATGDSTLTAYIDGSLGPVSVTTRNLNVEAGSGPDGLLADALLTGGGGAGLVGVGVSTATATQSSKIDARISGDVDIDAGGNVSVVSSSGEIVAKSEISTGSGAGAVNVEIINTYANNHADFDAVIEALDGAVPTIGANNLFVWSGASPSSTGSAVSGPTTRDRVISNLDSVLGTGSGAGLVSVSDPNARATDTMTVLARAGGNLTLSNDLFVIATSEVDVFSKPTGETVGLVSGNQGAHATSKRTGSTEARLATDCFGVTDCARITAGGDVTVTSEAWADVDSRATAGAGGFIATSNATATSTLDTSVHSTIGADETIETAGDVVMSATTPSTWATSASYAESGGAGVGVKSHAVSDIDLDVRTTIGERASIEANHVYATADTWSPFATPDAQVNFGAAGASVDVLSRGTVNSHAVVTQSTDAVIRARDGVTYRAEVDANLNARAVKGGEAIDGGSVISEALPVLFATVDFQDDAKIYTYDVDFEANATNIGTNTVAHNNSVTIDPVENDYIDPLAEVFVDGDIIMLNSLPQHLVVHDDGTIETVSGEITAQMVGGEVVVDDLVNDRVGSVRFAAIADIDDTEQAWIDAGFCDSSNFICDAAGWDSDNLFSALRNGRVRGTTGTLQYDNSYPYVLIENHSTYDLVVNDIVISTPETAAPTFTLDSDNTRNPDYLDWIAYRETVVDPTTTNPSFAGTYDHHLPSRYYLLTDDTTAIDFVPNDLVKPTAFGTTSPPIDRLLFVGTGGDSSIRVFNTTDADVIFKGRVDSEGQSGSIALFNEAGNLMAGNDDALFETTDFTAYAYDGYIGGAYDFDVDLVKVGSVDPVFTAFARDGMFIHPRVVAYGDGPAPASLDGATIGDVSSGRNVNLYFREGRYFETDTVNGGYAEHAVDAVYHISGDLFGLEAVQLRVTDVDDVTLNVTGTLESGVENIDITITNPLELLGDSFVEVDFSNVELVAPDPLLDYEVAVDRYTGKTYLYKPSFAETDAPAPLTGKTYHDGDLIDFQWTENPDEIVFDSAIEHMPGRIFIVRDGSPLADINVTGNGTLSQLDGYSHVTIDNQSGKALTIGLVDIDSRADAEDQQRVESAAGYVEGETEIEAAYALDVENFGNAEGLIDIVSLDPFHVLPGLAGDPITLTDDLLNRSGLTRIENQEGRIVQSTGGLVVRAHDIEFEAFDVVSGTGVIGTSAMPVRTDLFGGSLDAVSVGGGIYIDELFGDLSLRRADTTTGGHDVELTSAGGILDANGVDRNIYGKDVRLFANGGSIDTDVESTGYVDADALINIDLDSPAPIAFGTVDANGYLRVTADGAITDIVDSTLRVTGNARFDAGSNAITLGDNPGDTIRFGSLTFVGGDVDIEEDDGMELAGVNQAASVRLVSGGGITDTGSLAVVGTSDLSGSSIVLDSVDNDFGGTVDSSSSLTTLVDMNGIELGTTQVTTFPGGSGGSLTVRALSGGISDSGQTFVAGYTTLEATQDIVLDTPTNDFQGPVKSDGVNVTLVDVNGLVLGDTIATGDFFANAQGGGVGQGTSANVVNVDGITRVLATGAIDLDNTNNDFGGAVSAINSTLPHDGVPGPSINLYDDNDILLDEIVSGANLFVAAVGNVTDVAGSVIDVPYRAIISAFGDVTLGDQPGDAVNFGHYGQDAFGNTEYWGIEFGGRHVNITEHSSANFWATSHAETLVYNSYGDMTDTGSLEIAGTSSFNVTPGSSIYLDTKNHPLFGSSAYFGDVTFGTIAAAPVPLGPAAPPVNIDNIRFIDSSDLVLNPLTIDGFLDVAALYELRTSDLGPVQSLGGDISLNGYNNLTVGAGGVFGPGEINLAAAEGGFGLRPGQDGPGVLTLMGDVESSGGRVSLLAGDDIVHTAGTIRTPADASFMALRGRIGEDLAPVPVEIGGRVSLYQPANVGGVAGVYDTIRTRTHGLTPPDVEPYFENEFDVFFRGLPVIRPPRETTVIIPPPENIPPGECTDPAGCEPTETVVVIDRCEIDPASCTFLVPRGCVPGEEGCIPVDVVQCLNSADPGACMPQACADDPASCSLISWFERITRRPFEAPQGNTLASHDESSFEITICNGVSLFGQNEECNPVNEEVEIFEIDTPLYSVDPMPVLQ